MGLDFSMVLVTTCPFAGMRGEAHGCAFQRRKDARSRHQHLFVGNVGKTEGNRSKTKILSSGVVFTFEEGISSSHVCLKGQQPIFYFYLFVVDKGVSLAPTYPQLR